MRREPHRTDRKVPPVGRRAATIATGPSGATPAWARREPLSGPGVQHVVGLGAIEHGTRQFLVTRDRGHGDCGQKRN